MSNWSVRAARPDDTAGWATMRQALWPLDTLDMQVEDIRGFQNDGGVGFVAMNDDRCIGFAEAALRHDYVNGTLSSPVGFLEGWYVAPEWRSAGVGRALVEAVARWTRESGASELASDAALDNLDSHAAHAACGFEETERVVYFRMPLEA